MTKHKITSNNFTISESCEKFLDRIRLSRSMNTARAYNNGLNNFLKVLEENGLDPYKTPLTDLAEAPIIWFSSALKHYAPTTERLYLTAIVGFYEYIFAEELATPNLLRIRKLIQMNARKTGTRLPQFPRDSIEKILEYAQTLANAKSDSASNWLRNLRDRAFLITLADTGLRVHEACNLRRSNVDWNEGKAVIIGKGDKEAVVRFSKRSLSSLKDYLSARSNLDSSSGKPLATLPLFARHDKGAGKKVIGITTATGRNIVHQRVIEALGTSEEGNLISPHSFRHYFVTTVLRSSGNLKLAQELARHRNIAITQRYAHLSDDELDHGYHDIFS